MGTKVVLHCDHWKGQQVLDFGLIPIPDNLVIYIKVEDLKEHKYQETHRHLYAENGKVELHISVEIDD